MAEEHVLSLFKNKENVLTKVDNRKDKYEAYQEKLSKEKNPEITFLSQCWTTNFEKEAMWGIYAPDPDKRYLRIHSTPRKLRETLQSVHTSARTNGRCFVGKVRYKQEADLKEELSKFKKHTTPSLKEIANFMLLKRNAFSHEKEVRLIYLSKEKLDAKDNLYRYPVNPHEMIDQIMADPNRDRKFWNHGKARIKDITGLSEDDIKRSKIYDEPDESPNKQKSTVEK